mmetsp:Transcript_9641/g.30023  ORF Transcript_9641/g.30023 Transcript_9641/m.30023 type:complete len:160 (+) Transcript_9641:1395-1874(+)
MTLARVVIRGCEVEPRVCARPDGCDAAEEAGDVYDARRVAVRDMSSPRHHRRVTAAAALRRRRDASGAAAPGVLRHRGIGTTAWQARVWKCSNSSERLPRRRFERPTPQTGCPARIRKNETQKGAQRAVGGSHSRRARSVRRRWAGTRALGHLCAAARR